LVLTPFYIGVKSVTKSTCMFQLVASIVWLLLVPMSVGEDLGVAAVSLYWFESAVVKPLHDCWW
jgi:hypothetical protein